MPGVFLGAWLALRCPRPRRRGSRVSGSGHRAVFSEFGRTVFTLLNTTLILAMIAIAWSEWWFLGVLVWASSVRWALGDIGVLL